LFPTKPAAAAGNFRLDIKGAEVRRVLSGAGVATVVLKGAAFVALLYGSPGVRAYGDIDLLIDERQLSRAHAVLIGLGFERFDEDSPSAQTDPTVGDLVGALGALHGGAWVRTADGIVIDIHTTLPQVPANPATVWSFLAGHTQSLTVGGLEARVLDPPATALLVALHAAHHGENWGSALMDLRQAIAILDEDCWREARELARDLAAERPFGVGMGLDPDGRRMAQEFGLSTDPTPALRTLWRGGNWTEMILAALREEKSVVGRARLACRILWPSPAAIRRGSALARRGRAGLLIAYAWRPLQLTDRALRARSGPRNRRSP
jgi:hypothetical protein